MSSYRYFNFNHDKKYRYYTECHFTKYKAEPSSQRSQVTEVLPVTRTVWCIRWGYHLPGGANSSINLFAKPVNERKWWRYRYSDTNSSIKIVWSQPWTPLSWFLRLQTCPSPLLLPSRDPTTLKSLCLNFRPRPCRRRCRCHLDHSMLLPGKVVSTTRSSSTW